MFSVYSGKNNKIQNFQNFPEKNQYYFSKCAEGAQVRMSKDAHPRTKVCGVREVRGARPDEARDKWVLSNTLD